MPTTEARSRRWCFTLNNPTQEETDHIDGLYESGEHNISYLIYGREVGDNGTPHLQGFVRFAGNKSLAQVKAIVGDRAHYEITRGTSLQASEYCKKEGNFQTFGEVPQQGRTNHLGNFFVWADHFREAEGRVPTPRDVAIHHPTILTRYRNICEVLEARAPPTVLVVNPTPRPWQLELEEHLTDDTPDDRSVEFFVDLEGGKGKSWFQRHMLTKYPDKVQLLAPGKRDDLAHTIDTQKTIFLMNVPRQQMEYLQYSLLEQLKDRTVFSPKYVSRMKILSAPSHVIVFSNEHPDMNKMSPDRYIISEL